MSIEKILAEVKANKTIGVGQMTARIRALPPEEKARAIASLNFLENIETAGRWGSMPGAWDVLGVTDKAEREVAQRAFEACQADDVAMRVIERRGGSDAEVLPVPEPTRRDHLSAAFDLHNEE